MLPNFLIIGAGRSGTTTLYRYLQHHPQVFMSAVKEPGYFAYPGGKPHYVGPGDAVAAERLFTSRAAYETLFEGGTKESAVGEASTVYLHAPSAPEQILRYIPQAKLVAILRNPIDRGYSSFLMNRQRGHEGLSNYIDAVEAEEARLAAGWSLLFGYRRNGLYWEHLSRYLVRFPRPNIKVYLFEDLRDRPLWLLQDLFAFLEVDPQFRPAISRRHNASATSVLPLIDKLVHRESTLRRVMPRQGRALFRAVWAATSRRPSLSLKARETLLEYYRSDLMNLERMLEIDLSQWLRLEKQPVADERVS